MAVRRQEETSFAVAIGEKVREARFQRKLTQEQIAEATGLCLPSVQSIELGRVGIRGYGVVDLMRVCRELGLRVAVVPSKREDD